MIPEPVFTNQVRRKQCSLDIVSDPLPFYIASNYTGPHVFVTPQQKNDEMLAKLSKITRNGQIVVKSFN